jgi:phosphonate transport system substrate-binding protein
MRSFVRRLTTGFFLTLVALALPVGAQADVSITFGVYTSDKPSAMVRQLRPTLDLVEQSIAETLGEPVEIKLEVVRGYAAGAELILSGKADVMRLGPASYVKVKGKEAGIELLAMENKNGANTFEGVIVVHENSDITEMSQLRGRTFAFGSKRSTLGRYFAQLELTRAGILASDLKSYEYLGRHDKVGQAVGAGLFDAGALEGTMFKKLQAKGVPIRAIHIMRNATKAWAARAGLDPDLKQLVRQALLGINDNRALTALRFDGFLPGHDSDYDPTRAAINQNSEFFDSKS